MIIDRIKRLRITYAFWKALGAKKHNVVLAVVHECGFADVMSGKMPLEIVKTMQSEVQSAGYDYEHKTT